MSDSDVLISSDVEETEEEMDIDVTTDEDEAGGPAGSGTPSQPPNMPYPMVPHFPSYSFPPTPSTPHLQHAGAPFNHPVYLTPTPSLYSRPVCNREHIDADCEDLEDIQGSPLRKEEARALEWRFGQGLLHGLYYRQSERDRTILSWPKKLTDEERLLIMFNCMLKLGFTTLGDFLRVLFGQDHTSCIPVAQKIQYFLSASSRFESEHPISIVKLIFSHKKSETWTNARQNPIHFSIPQYALPPSKRLLSNARPQHRNSTRGQILDWAFQRVLEHVDSEAATLERLPVLTCMPEERITWERVLGWNMMGIQEKIASTAPVLFTLISTIAVSRDMRKRVLSASYTNAAKDTTDRGPDSASAATHRETGNSTNVPLDSQSSPIGTDPSTLEEEMDENLYSGAQETTGVPPRSKRDPWLAVTVAILWLLPMRYRYNVMFPTIVGLFLFSCNANREIILFLSRAGVSIAYSTILTVLHVLAADASLRLEAYGKAIEAAQPLFLLLFDNVNKMRRAWEQVLGHRDEVKSGTASSLIDLVDVPPGALNLEPLLARLKQHPRRKLTVKTLLEDINWPHLNGIGSATILRVCIKYVPALHHFHKNVKDLYANKYARHPLRLRKSEVKTMRPSNIDESSTRGTLQVIQNLVSQLGITTLSWLNQWVVFFCGDQLSIDRLRHVKMYTGKAEGAEKHEWVLPVIQLWHMKWAWQKAIFRQHWWGEASKDVPGLRYDTRSVFGRDKFNHDKCDFYQAHHILEDRFDSMILEAIRTVCEEKTGVKTAANKRLLDAVNSYFTEGGPYDSCTFDELLGLANIIYKRYLTGGAYTDTLSGARDESKYGPMPLSSGDCESEPTNHGTMRDGDNKSEHRTKPQRRQKPTATQERRNISSGDQLLANEIIFLRMTFWYLEMCAGISEGDIGRVMEILKVLRFSFWGVGSTNYANELLEQACNFLTEFSDDLKAAIFNNYLVNTSGLAGHWFELDLLQEHFNFWLKRLFNLKSHEFDSKHLAERVGLNIRGFSQLRDLMTTCFGLKRNSYKHTHPNRAADINALGKHLRDRGVLCYSPNRSHPYTVKDEFGEGMEILEDGGLARFIQRTSQGPRESGDGMNTDRAEHLDGGTQVAGSIGDETDNGDEFPFNPLVTSSEGILEATEFMVRDD